jgi:3',5'-cyclic AMP phosphodiesterase CpdA
MFTIAHLSDIHLAPLPRARMAELSPKQALGVVNWHGRRKSLHQRSALEALIADVIRRAPSHIAVTGDLTNIGLEAEMKAARAWLEALGTPERVTVIPGNHDVYGPWRSGGGISTWFPFMRSNERGQAFCRGVESANLSSAVELDPHAGFPFVKVYPPVALVGTSTAVPTPPFLASGRLGHRQLRSLETILGDLEAAGLARVLLIHHPPLPGQNGRLRGLEDASDLAAVLRRTGVEVVLHGHNHRQMLIYGDGPNGPFPVIGVASASAAPGRHDPAAGYNIIAVGGKPGKWQISFSKRHLAPDGSVRGSDVAKIHA